MNERTSSRFSFLMTVFSLITLFLVLNIFEKHLNLYMIRILNLCAIYVILGVSLNLIFGITGQFSLGHAGFMAVGSYTCALLTMPVIQKKMTFIITPLIYPFNVVQLPFFLAIVMGGLAAAGFGFLIGAPVLRLKGDYLAIASLGFAEIVRILANNLTSLTNGALGLKGIPQLTTLNWSWGWVVIALFVIRRLISSSYG